MDDPRIQSMFKRCRHHNLSFFKISQDYYELPKRTFPMKISIMYSNNYRDVQNLYQDEAPMEMTLKNFKLLTSTRWNENYQPLIFDMTTDEYTCRYCLGLNSICSEYKSFLGTLNEFLS